MIPSGFPVIKGHRTTHSLDSLSFRSNTVTYAVHSVGYGKTNTPSLAITINVIEECTEVPLGCPNTK
uniref:Uncharacterized protein n=1 Tax=Glossina pallidipes TaxID=7398 RepID=A0A1A9Z690_GLOPL